MKSHDYHNFLIDSAVNKINLEIVEAAYNTTPAGLESAESLNSFSVFYFFESGRVTVKTKNKETVLEPGNIYIIPQGMISSSYSSEGHTKLYFLFRIKLPDGNDLLHGIDEVLSLYVGNAEIARVKNLFDSKNLFDALKIKSMILEYTLRMIPESASVSIPSVVYSPRIQQVINYIKDNLSIQLSVKAISEHFNIPATTLSKHFQKEVGVNIGKYIDNVVFDEAKMLLISNIFSIQEISEKLGFCDRFYFSRRFKAKFLITPHKYRKLKTTTFV